MTKKLLKRKIVKTLRHDVAIVGIGLVISLLGSGLLALASREHLSMMMKIFENLIGSVLITLGSGLLAGGVVKAVEGFLQYLDFTDDEVRKDNT